MNKQDCNPHFIDISDIRHKDVNIDFSVEELLAKDEYLMTPCRPHKQKPKVSADPQKTSSRKELALEIKKSYLDSEKMRKKSIAVKLKPKEHPEEKDTQDNSETVKIVSKHLSPKLNAPRKISKVERAVKESGNKMSTNKIQPFQKQRSRTKSISSIQSIRKKPQLLVGQVPKTPTRNNLSIRSNPSSQLVKARSQTIKCCLDEIKALNQQIVRKDYFDEQNQNSPPHPSPGYIETVHKKRTISSHKKAEFQNSKIKKLVNQSERQQIRSPKVNKKMIH